MNKIINLKNLRNFCYLNDDKVVSNPKGLIIEFRGLGAQTIFGEYEKANVYSENNILYMIPYLNPWNWMNEQAIIEVEEIIEVIKEKYNVKEMKIASTGNSMGGLSSLVYAAYAKTVPSVVVSNCPVCDLEYHYTERFDLPRTLYSAFYNASVDKDFNDVLKEYSPIRLCENDKLPKTKYFIFHCMKDSAVNINKHSEILVKEMNKKNYEIEFIKVPERDHCDLDEKANEQYKNILLEIFK